MFNFFNDRAIVQLQKNVRTAPRGFRYGFVKDIFKDDVYEKLIKTFPPVETFTLVDKQSGGGHKRFYVGPVYSTVQSHGCVCHLRSLPILWQRTLEESASAAFINRLQWATGVTFNSLCNFGLAYSNTGCVQEPHLDGAVRSGDKNSIHSTIAGLLYCNKSTGGPGGTRVYDIDRKTIIFEVPCLHNSFFFFEQHPDAWHGFPLVGDGHDRRLVSVAYSIEQEPIILKDSFFHRLLCLKNIRRLVYEHLRS